MGKKDAEAEDLAIQDTLAMSVQERLQLVAALIVDKIDEDQRGGRGLLKAILGARDA